MAVDGGYQYSGDQVHMPTVFPFQASSEEKSNQALFMQTFSRLPTQLEACWTIGGNIQTTIGTMKSLKPIGQALIQAGVRPQFTFGATKATTA